MRGKKAPKRLINPDTKYGNVTLAKFMNMIMKHGKKTIAEKIIYGMLDIVGEKTKKDPIEVFENAIKNVSPSLEVKSKRVGGANYQVPMPVRAERKLGLAFRWIIAAANAKKGKPMAEKLAIEFMDAAEGNGDAVKKKMDVQRMAEANRAFAHFAR
ncbi:MAG: 30S ribosomal protein S7 [bacterium]